MVVWLLEIPFVSQKIESRHFHYHTRSRRKLVILHSRVFSKIYFPQQKEGDYVFVFFNTHKSQKYSFKAFTIFPSLLLFSFCRSLAIIDQ